MKRIIKNLGILCIFLLSRNAQAMRITEKFWRSLIYHSRFFKNNEDSTVNAIEIADSYKLASACDAPLVVEGGICEGLKYPYPFSHGSIFLGKLKGIYECEISGTLIDLVKKNTYSTFVDIGAAEGFYALGIAQRIKNLEVFAFDNAPLAKELMRRLVEFNELEDRVHICNFCNSKTLKLLPLKGRSLLMSDCEGYEGELFQEEHAEYLANCDIVIELHRTAGQNIRKKLESIFARTHQSEFIRTMSAIQKFVQFRPKFDASVSDDELFLMVNEQRTESFGWLILRARANA